MLDRAVEFIGFGRKLSPVHGGVAVRAEHTFDLVQGNPAMRPNVISDNWTSTPGSNIRRSPQRPMERIRPFSS